MWLLTKSKVPSAFESRSSARSKMTFETPNRAACLGLGQHGRRNVERNDTRKLPGQREGQAADTTAMIERALPPKVAKMRFAAAEDL